MSANYIKPTATPLDDSNIERWLALSEEYREKFRKYLVSITGNVFKLTGENTFLCCIKHKDLLHTFLWRDGKKLNNFDTLEAAIDYLSEGQWKEAANAV